MEKITSGLQKGIEKINIHLQRNKITFRHWLGLHGILVRHDGENEHKKCEVGKKQAKWNTVICSESGTTWIRGNS